VICLGIISKQLGHIELVLSSLWMFKGFLLV
jgi:hypothetical protein